MCFLIKKTKSYNLNDSPKSRSFSQGRNSRLCSRPRSFLQGPTTGAFSRQTGGQQRGSPGAWCVPGQCGYTQRPQTPWRAMVSPSPEPPSSKTAVLRFLPPNYCSSPFQRCLGAHFLSWGFPHQARRSLQPTQPLVQAPRAVWGAQVTLMSEWVWKHRPAFSGPGHLTAPHQARLPGHGDCGRWRPCQLSPVSMAGEDHERLSVQDTQPPVSRPHLSSLLVLPAQTSSWRFSTSERAGSLFPETSCLFSLSRHAPDPTPQAPDGRKDSTSQQAENGHREVLPVRS